MPVLMVTINNRCSKNRVLLIIQLHHQGYNVSHMFTETNMFNSPNAPLLLCMCIPNSGVTIYNFNPLNRTSFGLQCLEMEYHFLVLLSDNGICFIWSHEQA